MTEDTAPAQWRIESNSTKSLALAAGCFLAGVLFLWLTRGAAPGDGNALAARCLGVLLAALGIAAFVFHEDVVLTVDRARGRLHVERRTRWGTARAALPFGAVEAVRVVKIGTRSDGTPSYWLHVRTKTGKAYNTGRWSTDQQEINRLAEQLAADVGCASETGRPLAPATAGHLAVAAAGAVAAYALWFRVAVGPWCPAMWFGTAPPVIVLVAFFTLLGLLRRFAR